MLMTTSSINFHLELVVLTINWKSRMDLQNIWTRDVGCCPINNSTSNIFFIMLFPERVPLSYLAVLDAASINGFI